MTGDDHFVRPDNDELAPTITHPEAQGNKDLGGPAASGLEKAGHRLGSIRTPRMNGDNLAIVLCGYFDNPDQDADDEHGWTPDAIAGCEEVLAAIRAHYQAALAAAPTSPQPIKGESELESASNGMGLR